MKCINLATTEQTDEALAAREAIENDCPLALQFAHSDDHDLFDLDGYTEALEALDGNPPAAMAAWLSNGCSVDSFSDCYQGEWDDEVSFAENLIDDCGMLDSMPENLRYYFDYEAFTRDMFINDYLFLDGFVFSNC